MIGQIVGNYKILEKIGEGGMGVVYKAQHLTLNRWVAIKSLNSNFTDNLEMIARFKNEAKILSDLQHPNIITLYDYFEDPKGYYFIMEYFEGITLQDYLKNVIQKIPETQAILIFEQLLSGFAYAHSQGVVHRDIKPSNILINSKQKIKILDFGIAKFKESSIKTKSGIKMGTILYMSPEQIQSHAVDHRTDIYSLGVVLWEMVTGKCPYDMDTQSEFEISIDIVQNPLPHPKTIQKNCSDKIFTIIQKCTAKNPENRYKNCEQIRMDTLFYYPELFQKSSPTKKIINYASDMPMEVKPFPWKTITIIFLLLTIGIGSYFLFFFQNYSEHDIKNKVLAFYDKMNHHDISIKDMVEPHLKNDFKLENLRKAGVNYVDTSSFSIQKIEDGYKVHFIRKNVNHQQEIFKKTTVFLRNNDLKIYLIHSLDIKNDKNQQEKNANQKLIETEIINFIVMFYQYADKQDIEGLLKCYDNQVEKWFLENKPVTKDYIRQNASQYIQKVENEKTETSDYQILPLGNNRFEVHFRIDYSYNLKTKGIVRNKRKGTLGEVTMKLRKEGEDFKIYYLELKNQKEY